METTEQTNANSAVAIATSVKTSSRVDLRVASSKLNVWRTSPKAIVDDMTSMPFRLSSSLLAEACSLLTSFPPLGGSPPLLEVHQCEYLCWHSVKLVTFSFFHKSFLKLFIKVKPLSISFSFDRVSILDYTCYIVTFCTIRYIWLTMWTYMNIKTIVNWKYRLP